MKRLQKRRRREARLAPPAGLPVESVMYNLCKVLSQRDIATAMEVNRWKAQGWEYMKSVEDDVLQRLRELLGILYRLNTCIPFGEVKKWMRKKNPLLGGQRALDVFREPGGAEKIHAAIEAWAHESDQSGR